MEAFILLNSQYEKTIFNYRLYLGRENGITTIPDILNIARSCCN